jgi:hypothetical protein
MTDFDPVVAAADPSGQSDTIFGAVPAGFLEIVGDDDRPSSATAQVDALGSGFPWRRIT